MKKEPKTPVETSAEVEESPYTSAELIADLQRTRADFENYRKQVELQRTQAMETARFATVSKILPLLDDIDRAIQAHPAELSPLAKSFEKILTELKLIKINSEPGVEFDPELHDAIAMDDEEAGERTVVTETLRSGYFYDGQVLRPAMVKAKTTV